MLPVMTEQTNFFPFIKRTKLIYEASTSLPSCEWGRGGIIHKLTVSYKRYQVTGILTLPPSPSTHPHSPHPPSPHPHSHSPHPHSPSPHPHSPSSHPHSPSSSHPHYPSSSHPPSPSFTLSPLQV